MKISKETIKILADFSTIDNKILVDAGSTLVVNGGAGVAIANVPEVFPHFAIFSITTFLGIASLINSEDREFEFEFPILKIRGATGEIEYNLSETAIFNPNPDLTMFNTFDAYLASFKLTKADLSAIMKAASLLKIGKEHETVIDFKFKNNAGSITVKGAQKFTQKIDSANAMISADVTKSISASNLVLPVTDYDVFVAEKFVKFSDCNRDVKYFLRLMR